MTKKLWLSKDVGLPLDPDNDALSDVTAIVGRRGRGKTNTAVVMVEEAHANRRRFCVVDPTGAWWGLRSSRDGLQPGIPCVLFGGKTGMAPLEPTAGKLLAEFVADPAQPSCVLNIKPWSRGEQVRFLADFLSTLYQKNENPLLLVLDEADQVAPQRAESPGENVMLGAANRLVKLGRVSGFGVILVTQRPASLNKNVLNMAGVLIALGLTGPQDHAAILDWIKHRAEPARAKEVMATLPGMARGHAWVWAPEINLLQRAEIRERHTFDSSATPKAGAALVQPRAVADVDLQKLSTAIQGTIERAKANDPAALRARVAELEAQLESEDHGLADEELERIGAAEAEVRKLRERFSLAYDAIRRDRQRVRTLVSEMNQALDALDDDGYAGIAEALDATAAEIARRPAPRERFTDVRVEPPLRRLRRELQAPHHDDHQEHLDASEGGRENGETKCLRAVAQHPEGCDRTQVSVLTGYKKSSRDQFLSRLSRKGLVEIDGQTITATAAGRKALGPSFKPLPTGKALRDYWLARLPEGERIILQIAIQAYPEAVSRETVSARTSYKKSSRDQFISRLSRRKLVTTPRAGVRLSEHMA